MKNFSTFCLILAVAAAIGGAAADISPAQPPAEADCSPLVYGMVECMGFLAEGGVERLPRPTCCLAFRALVAENADCVCSAISAAASFGIAVDMSRVRVLPLACGVDEPFFTACNVGESPNGSPGAPLLPPASGISAPPSANSGVPDAPAPAPASSSSVVSAIYFNFVFAIISFFFFIYA